MSGAGITGPIWLVGFMGSGKSAVGRELAGVLDWELVDVDARVASAAGRTIEEIFRESGEGRFREMERRELERNVEARRAVVATGGGSFVGRANRELMKRHGVIVWLDVPLDVARRRLGKGPGRPLWTDPDGVTLRAFFERRRAVYALADVRVDASRGSPRTLARRVLRAIGR